MGAARRAGVQAASPRARFNWPLVAFALAVSALGLSAGTLLDAGPAATLGAVTALFVGFGASGGSLRADVRLLLAMAPLFVVATAGPRWLAQFSPAVALVLLALLILVAGVLPAQGPRWATVGKGLALTSIMGYALPLSHPATGGQLVAAAVAGLLVAGAMRVLSGIADPGRPVREKVAGVLTSPRPDVGGALVAWLQDRPTAWLGDALAAATAYRALRTASPPVGQAEARLDARAGEVAGLVLARAPVSSGGDAWPAVEPAGIALERAASAAITRGGAVVAVPAASRRRLVAAIWAAPLTWRSDQVRHAARTSFAVLVAGSLALALLTPGEPLLATLMMTTYGVLQSRRSATLANAGQRISGVAVGAVLAAVVVWVAPSSWLLPLSMAALVVGLGTMLTLPPVSYAAFVLVTVGMNVGARHRDPEATLGGYLLLVALALTIGVVIAFAVVPGIRPALHADGVATARVALAEALEALAGGAGQRDSVGDVYSVRDALRATHALDALGEGSGDRRLVDVAAALVALAVLIAAGGAPGAAATIHSGAAAIRGQNEQQPGDDATGLPALFVRLAGDVAAELDARASSGRAG